MANQTLPKQFSLLGLLLLLIAITLLITHTQAAKLSVYWGHHGRVEGRLSEACQGNKYDIVNIAYLSKFGGGQKLMLNLKNHCNEADKTCKDFNTDIKECQRLGVKVLLSIGGADSGNYTLHSIDDARSVADDIWKNYIGGNKRRASRPFGDAVLDGVDFDIQKGGEPRLWAELAISLRRLSINDEIPLYLSASPGCSYPNKHLDLAVRFVPFDFVSIKFYDDKSCEFSGDTATVMSQWKNWAEQLEKDTTLLFGLTPCAKAAKSGYITPTDLKNSIIPELCKESRFGGFMIYSRNFDKWCRYSQEFRDDIKNQPPCPASPPLALSE